MAGLRAAAGEVDLAPPAGGWMTGFALRVEPATGTHDPLVARALLLDGGDGRLAIVVCDLLGLAPEAVVRIRGAIAGAGVFPSGRVLIACTHTHSGPACMPMHGALAQVDEAWLAQAEARIAGLVVRLAERLEAAAVAWGRIPVAGIGYNRQDGVHPSDEELVTLAVERTGGEAVATLLSYATHAVVLGSANRLFSGDWPGAAARGGRATRRHRPLPARDLWRCGPGGIPRPGLGHRHLCRLGTGQSPIPSLRWSLVSP